MIKELANKRTGAAAKLEHWIANAWQHFGV
jgi:hypothetical protein